MACPAVAAVLEALPGYGQTPTQSSGRHGRPAIVAPGTVALLLQHPVMRQCRRRIASRLPFLNSQLSGC